MQKLPVYLYTNLFDVTLDLDNNKEINQIMYQRPLKIQKGEFISFYGNKCLHYNMLNTTGKTRISLDFRVIPGSIYKDSLDKAIHSNRKFIVGEYYTVFKSEK